MVAARSEIAYQIAVMHLAEDFELLRHVALHPFTCNNMVGPCGESLSLW